MINILKKYYSEITPNLFWSFASKAVAAIAFIGIDVLLARVLEPELFGKWQQFFSLLTLLLFITYAGIPAATQAFAAQNIDSPKLKYIISNSLLLQIVFSGIATGLVLLMRTQIAGVIDQPEFSRFLLLAAPFLVIGSLEEYLKNVYVGIKRTQYHFYMNVMSFGLRLIILALLTRFFFDIPAIIFGYSAAMLIAVIAGLVMIRNHYSKIPEMDFPKPKYFKKILLYSLPLAISYIILKATSEINIQLLGLLTNHTEVAFLAVGKQITEKLPQISMAISMGILPDFARINIENKQRMKKRFSQLLKLNFILFGFISGGIIVFSPLIVPIIYGPSYSNAVLPLQILALNLFFGSMNIYLYRLLSYHGKASQIAKLIVMTLIINILLNLLLIPKFGAVGSAVALTLAFLPNNFLLYKQSEKVFEGEA